MSAAGDCSTHRCATTHVTIITNQQQIQIESTHRVQTSANAVHYPKANPSKTWLKHSSATLSVHI